MDNYFALDIETAPIDLTNYFSLPEEERLKKINPIDSRVIAIGIRFNGQNNVIYNNDEKKMLEDFWAHWGETKKNNPYFYVVGFNHSNFDVPFLITRSFIHNVKIYPFTLKELIDIKEKISAYRSGPTRGKLKEFAQMVGIEILDVSGEDMPKLYSEGKIDQILKYLEKDLEITDSLYKRADELNITRINRW